MTIPDYDLNLGIAGVSEGNGHPYSFASIVNGYSEEGFAATEWDVIAEYLREKDPSEFGFPGVEVTHAWTQDADETDRLCSAAKIPHSVDELDDLAAVDAVILARDDYENHLEMALPFLEAEVPVFVDKPLALDPEEVATLKPYLETGQLMSCSGMRYARELDQPRANLDAYGTVKLVRGAVINDWAKYGVHMLDAIFGVLDTRPVKATATDVGHMSVTIEMSDNTLVQIDALGDAPITFDVDIYGSERTTHHELRDNFRAFRRTLWHFIESIRTGEPALPPEETLDVLRVLVAGRRSLNAGTPVPLEEVGV